MANIAAVEKGAFAAVELPAVLRQVIGRHQDGRARVIQRAVTRFVWFEGGRVCAINSSLEDEQLGSWLATRNLVDKRLLGDLLARKSRGERLGDLLVRRGLLPRDTLQDELETLTLTIAGRMLFETGEYVAEPGLRVPERTASVELTVTPLFVAAARRAPDNGQFERVSGDGLRWLAVRMAEDRGYEVALLPPEKLVLERLAKPQTIDELRALVPLDAPQVARSLVCLTVAGMVAPVSDAALAARAARDREAAAAAAAAAATAAREQARAAAQARAASQPPTAAQQRPTAATASPTATPPRPAPAPGAGVPAANSWLRDVLASVDPYPETAEGGAGDGRRSLSPAERVRAQADKRAALRLLDSGEDPRKAYRLLSRAVETAPDADSLVKLAELEIATPQWRPRALEHLKLAVQLAPQCTPAWLALANYWGDRGQIDRQRRCLEKILAYDHTNEDVRRALQALR